MSPDIHRAQAAERMRRRVYTRNLWARHRGANSHSKIPDFDPELARRAPQRFMKLTPWIRRELRAITQVDNVETVKDFIIALLSKYDPQTDAFIEGIRGYLHADSTHFVHELVAFARSPFDIDAYDREVQYGESHETGKVSYPTITIAERENWQVDDFGRVTHRQGRPGVGQRGNEPTQQSAPPVTLRKYEGEPARAINGRQHGQKRERSRSPPRSPKRQHYDHYSPPHRSRDSSHHRKSRKHAKKHSKHRKRHRSRSTSHRPAWPEKDASERISVRGTPSDPADKRTPRPDIPNGAPQQTPSSETSSNTAANDSASAHRLAVLLREKLQSERAALLRKKLLAERGLQGPALAVPNLEVLQEKLAKEKEMAKIERAIWKDSGAHDNSQSGEREWGTPSSNFGQHSPEREIGQLGVTLVNGEDERRGIARACEESSGPADCSDAISESLIVQAMDQPQYLDRENTGDKLSTFDDATFRLLHEKLLREKALASCNHSGEVS